MKNKDLILLSGGVDSTVLLASLIQKTDWEYEALSIYYGQKHHKEMYSAKVIAAKYNTPRKTLSAEGLLQGSCLLRDEEPIPKGLHYEDPKQASTVVPGRNLLFLSMAIAFAARHLFSTVYIGAHKGDAAIYPDCREEFIRAVDDAAYLAYRIRVVAPFLNMTKTDIVRLGKRLKVPFELTWSCYEGKDSPCGECGACVELVEAFQKC
jgi:7-cyano-7-deazaguanine synthase